MHKSLILNINETCSNGIILRIIERKSNQCQGKSTENDDLIDLVCDEHFDDVWSGIRLELVEPHDDVLEGRPVRHVVD
jgi:hypothetical protein